VDVAGIEPATPACKANRENTKQLCWCRLRGKSTKFPLLKYPEVVPNFTMSVGIANLDSLTDHIDAAAKEAT
jgi:hypothetical protein